MAKIEQEWIFSFLQAIICEMHGFYAMTNGI